MPAFINRAGQRFGRWLVLSRAANRGVSTTAWLCQCDCGKQAEVRACHLVSGASKSCGCWNDEVRIIAHTKHGHTPLGVRQPPEYQTWAHMKARCLNPRSSDFRDYGGRGITICKEWREDYATFLRDMGPRPSARHSIDRINVNGNYEPGNCRWATAYEQSRNTTRTKLTLAAVWVIRGVVTHGFPKPEIQRQFGISKGYLNRVVSGDAWGIPRKHRIRGAAA